MNISYNFKKIIVDEFEYIVGKMRAEPDPRKKLFLFSASYGVIQRILNIEFDQSLVLIHFILNGTYTAINARISAISQQADVGVEIPHDLFTKLEDETEKLGKAIDRNTDPSDILRAMALMAYSTTGNGSYLYQKGVLKL